MKLKYILSGLLATVMLLPSCVEVDEMDYPGGVGSHQLSIKGFLVNDYADEIPSVIDDATGTITVQVPYYISNTDPIMGDLTQMKLEAQLPVGCKFSPSLTGIHDLEQGFNTSLIGPNGQVIKEYTIIARYTKNSQAEVLEVGFDKLRPIYTVEHPAAPGEHGLITIYKTSSSLDGAISKAIITVSPWATIECAGYDPSTGYIDLTSKPSIKIISQDGETSAIYDVEIDTPAIKEVGVGYISALFGQQFYKSNNLGLELGCNSTIACVDNYLIISNSKNPGEMIVLDRYLGTPENVKVNASGMPSNREFRAICHDDAGHLIAAAFCASAASSPSSPTPAHGTTDAEIFIYAWENGITNPPTLMLQKKISDPYCAAIHASYRMFYNINARGNIFSGDCAVSTGNLFTYGGIYVFQFKDGQPDGNAVYVHGGGIQSSWVSSNGALMTNKAPYGFLTHTGNWRATVTCKPAESKGFDFSAPGVHWWTGNTQGVDYIEFNGYNLVAVANGNASKAYRLWVSNITATPNAGSLKAGFIFDSREGDATSGTAKIKGSGYAITGMLSGYTFTSGEIVFGDVFRETNCELVDVKFVRSADGNAVQVYLFDGDYGMFGYEITRYDL